MKFEGPVEIFNGLLEAAEAVLGVSTVPHIYGVIRSQPDRLVVVLQGFFIRMTSSMKKI